MTRITMSRAPALLLAPALLAALAAPVTTARAQVCEPALVNTLDLIDPRDVEVAGDLLLVADGSAGLRVYLIAHPASPESPALLGVLPGPAFEVEAVGTRAYITSARIEQSAPIILSTVDLSDPSTPQIIGSTPLGTGVVRDMDANDTAVFVARNLSGDVVDVTDPAAPQVVATIPALGGFETLAVEGDTLFVVSNPFRAWDISNPAEPVEIGSVSGMFDATGMTIDDGIAYVSAPQFLVVDVSDPTAMVSAIIEIPSLPPFGDPQVQGGVLYTANSGGIAVHDVSDPFAPAWLGSVSLGASGTRQRIALSGSTLFASWPSPKQLLLVDVGQCPRGPLVTAQPASASAVTGDPAVEFQVGASFASAFQWRRDGEPLADGPGVAGAQTPTLSIEPGPDSAGLYDVVLTNAQGSVTSDRAGLVIEAGCLADLAAPFGILNFFDVSAFINAFNAGCP